MHWSVLAMMLLASAAHAQNSDKTPLIWKLRTLPGTVILTQEESVSPQLTSQKSTKNGTYAEQTSGDIQLLFECFATDLRADVRVFPPAQAFPQPKLDVKFGQVTRSATPTATVSGHQASLQVIFPVAKDVLAAIGDGRDIQIQFNGQIHTFRAALEPERNGFAQACAALYPGGEGAVPAEG